MVYLKTDKTNGQILKCVLPEKRNALYVTETNVYSFSKSFGNIYVRSNLHINFIN